MTTEHPDRFVDREMHGWWRMGVDGEPRYASRERYRTGEYLTYERAAAEYGPLRPVEPMSDEDRAAVATALRSAGTRAVGTLAAALGAVWEDGLRRFGGEDAETAMRALTAGRPSSWEADLLREATYFGRDLLHGSPRRIDQDAFSALHDVLGRAVHDDGPHHELAETLAGIVGTVADERPDGWMTVVDQWLSPGSLSARDSALAYRLFYSTSPRYDAALGEA